MQTTVRVLLVDDEESSFLLLRRLLDKVPGKIFATEWAASYEAGLSALKENRHDVCLLDFRLGARTGLELLLEAIARGVQTAMLVLTTHDAPQMAQDRRLYAVGDGFAQQFQSRAGAQAKVE